jgi:hypothetical protein
MSKGKYTLGTFFAVKQKTAESIYSHDFMQCSLYEAPTITMHIFTLMRHLSWWKPLSDSMGKINISILKHFQNTVVYDNHWCLGYVMENQKELKKSTWTSSIFHIQSSTKWTNSSSEPHLVFAYIWNWKSLQIHLYKKQSHITADKAIST